MHLSWGSRTSKNLFGGCSASTIFSLFTYSRSIVNGASANHERSTQPQVNNWLGHPNTSNGIPKAVESAELLN